MEGKWRKTVLFFAAEKITNGGERRRRKEEKRERERMMAGGMGWDKQEAEEGYDDKATPTGKKKGFSPLFSRSAGSLAGPGPRTEAAGG